ESVSRSRSCTWRGRGRIPARPLQDPGRSQAQERSDRDVVVRSDATTGRFPTGGRDPNELPPQSAGAADSIRRVGVSPTATKRAGEPCSAEGLQARHRSQPEGEYRDQTHDEDRVDRRRPCEPLEVQPLVERYAQEGRGGETGEIGARRQGGAAVHGRGEDEED